MAPPFLKGVNIVLRPLTPADARGPYIEWFNDRDVCTGNAHHRVPFTEAEAIAYIEQAQRFTRDLILAIATVTDGRHIGNIALKKIDPVVRSAEFAIVIGDKESWGKGVGKEAGRLLVDHAFFQLNLNRVYCGTFETNTAMRRLASYLGMVEEGCRREAAFKDNQYVAVVEYGVLRSEYIARFAAGASHT